MIINWTKIAFGAHDGPIPTLWISNNPSCYIGPKPTPLLSLNKLPPQSYCLIICLYSFQCTICRSILALISFISSPSFILKPPSLVSPSIALNKSSSELNSILGTILSLSLTATALRPFFYLHLKRSIINYNLLKFLRSYKFIYATEKLKLVSERADSD